MTKRPDNTCVGGGRERRKRREKTKTVTGFLKEKQKAVGDKEEE